MFSSAGVASVATPVFLPDKKQKIAAFGSSYTL
jgi:hypothetical protein